MDKSATKTVLYVDDEVNLLKALKRTVIEEPFELLTSASGQEGLEILATQPVQVVISDLRMPEMSGLEFLKQVEALYPNTVRVILSGHVDLNTLDEAFSTLNIFRILTKPWNEDEFLLTIHQGFEHYHR